jgi:hypothetical protein
LTNEQLKDDYGFDEMDIDNDEDGDGHKANDGERKADKVGDTQGEEQAKEDSGDKKKSAGSDDPLPSVELNQGDSNSENLFTPEADPSDASDSESAAFSDPEYGKALYSRPGPKSMKDAETVGWARPSGRTTLYINQYGKKNAARYRLEKFAQSAEYEDKPPQDHNVSNSVKRIDNEKRADGSWKYTKRHIKGIFGVAWKVSSTGKDREDDLDLINPDLVTKWTDVPSYILIAWDLEQGQVKKCWEPRATLRSRWGKKDADVAIYEAAVTAEERYIEGQTGKRRAISKSPSVGLAQSHVDRQRARSLGTARLSASRSVTPGANANPSKSLLRAPFSYIFFHGVRSKLKQLSQVDGCFRLSRPHQRRQARMPGSSEHGGYCVEKDVDLIFLRLTCRDVCYCGVGWLLQCCIIGVFFLCSQHIRLTREY